MSKQTNRKPFFAQLLDNQPPSADIETKKFPSDSEDFAWSDTQVSSKAKPERK